MFFFGVNFFSTACLSRGGEEQPVSSNGASSCSFGVEVVAVGCSPYLSVDSIALNGTTLLLESTLKYGMHPT
jgi:hypothetical protein